MADIEIPQVLAEVAADILAELRANGVQVTDRQMWEAVHGPVKRRASAAGRPQCVPDDLAALYGAFETGITDRDSTLLHVLERHIQKARAAQTPPWNRHLGNNDPQHPSGGYVEEAVAEAQRFLLSAKHGGTYTSDALAKAIDAAVEAATKARALAHKERA